MKFSHIIFACIFACGMQTLADERFIGSPAPDIISPAIDGSEYVLSQNFKSDSRRAVAICFFASWCYLCQKELALIQKLVDSLYKEDLVAVAICIEDSFGTSQAEFIRTSRFSFPVILDRDDTLGTLYRRPRKLPYSVLINNRGVVFTTVSGYSERAESFIHKAFNKMIVSRH